MQDNVFIRLRGPNIVGSSVFALTGFFLYLGLVLNLYEYDYFDLIRALLIVFSMFFFNIFIWTSNDYYDAPYDKEDEKKRLRNVFCDNSDSRDYRIGMMTIWISLIAGLICGWFAGLEYFLITVAGMLLAYLYNSPIFRAKSRSVFDWIFHVVWFQITILPLYLYIFGFDVIWGFEPKNILFYSIFLYISLLSLLAQINHQIPDYDLDYQTNQRTTVVILGIENTKKLRSFFYLLITLSVLVICLVTGTIIGLSLICIYTIYSIKTNDKRAEEAPLLWIYLFISDYLIISPLLSFILRLF